MITPINCPYKGLTAPPCWTCANHIADTDECALNSIARTYVSHTGTSTNAFNARTYEERYRDYEKHRQELLQLSKEALVDLIIKPPTYG